jgi:hypothetical protein
MLAWTLSQSSFTCAFRKARLRAPGETGVVTDRLPAPVFAFQAAESEILTAAFGKARLEKAVRQALEDGLPAKAGFEKYGIL